MLLYMTYKKLVAILKKRKQTTANEINWLGDGKMAHT